VIVTLRVSVAMALISFALLDTDPTKPARRRSSPA